MKISIPLMFPYHVSKYENRYSYLKEDTSPILMFSPLLFSIVDKDKLPTESKLPDGDAIVGGSMVVFILCPLSNVETSWWC